MAADHGLGESAMGGDNGGPVVGSAGERMAIRGSGGEHGDAPLSADDCWCDWCNLTDSPCHRAKKGGADLEHEKVGVGS